MKYRKLINGDAVKIGDEIYSPFYREWFPCVMTVGIKSTSRAFKMEKFRRPIKENKKKAKKKLYSRKTRAHKKGTNK